MIDEIDILQDCKSRHFGRDAGEESLWLLCVIAYHHELIIELREESFDSFSKTLVCIGLGALSAYTYNCNTAGH